MATQVASTTAPGQTTGQAGGNPQFASLYIGDLMPEVTEAVLYEVFNTVGPVASIRVCRDSITRRSLGYAYVNFHSVQDAERALDSLNFSNIKGHPCRIMWSHRDPALRRSGSANIYVKNLDKDIDDKALHDTFCLFGNILSCKVARDPDGKSRGFGFVHFETEEAATGAIEKLNGMKIGTKTVFVAHFQKQSDRDTGTPKAFTNIYVKHIPDSWDETKVKETLDQYGEITSFCVKTDAKNRRFAFANFADFDSAKRAVDELHGQDMRTDEEKAKELTEEEKNELEAEKDDEIYTYQLYVSRAQNKSERLADLKSKFQQNTPTVSAVTATSAGGANKLQPANLYIKNLGETVDDEGLKKMFESFGTITSSKVMRDEKGVSRGFGFVCFAAPEEATRAVTEMHLKLIGGKPLYVGLHEKREQRLERLQNRYRVPNMGGMGGGPMGGGPMNQPGMMMRGGMGGFGQQQMYGGFNQNGMGGGPMGRPGMHSGMMGGNSRGMPGMMQYQGQRMGAPQPGQMPYMMGHQMQGGMRGAGMMPGGAPKPMQPRPGPGMMQPGMMQPGAMRQPMQPGMAGRMGGQFQFTNQARNQAPQMMGPPGMGMMGGMPQHMQQAPQMVPHPAGPSYDPSAPLTAAALAAAPPGVQKQMLGEKLFPAISRLQPDLAGKITGMILEMDNSEILILLESEQQLRHKVDEALRVLQG